MTSEQIARINALARRKREEGLCGDELAELQALRAQYLREFRANLRAQLDQVYVQQEDGSYQKLTRKDHPDKENDP